MIVFHGFSVTILVLKSPKPSKNHMKSHESTRNLVPSGSATFALAAAARRVSAIGCDFIGPSRRSFSS
jgi:hypothetical protein